MFFAYSELEKEVKKHERQLSELEEQQKKILANVRKDTNDLEKQRQNVIRELEKVESFSFQIKHTSLEMFYTAKFY